MFGLGKNRALSERRKHLRSLLYDFTHLRIDTQVVEAVSGISAPAPAIAVAEIIESYETQLLALKYLNEHECWGCKVGSDITDTVAHLRLLAQHAKQQLVSHNSDDASVSGGKNNHLLRRIGVNAENLADMLDAIGDWLNIGDDAFSHTRLKINHMWELGTNPIIMQTVIGLDGDVVNRVDADYVGADFVPLHQIHQRAVRTGLEAWNRLIETVVKLVDTIIDRR